MEKQSLVPNQFLYKHVCLDHVFSLEECQSIIDLQGEVSDSNLERGIDQAPGVNYSVRKSKILLIRFQEENRWLYEKIHALFHLVNNKYYQFQLVNLFEIHRLEYPEGGLFDWHSDLGIGKTANRKLSLVVFLNAEDEYSGGQLVLSQFNRTLSQSQGTAIVFPSYIPHQVTPINSGIRYSLVAWAYGPSFT